MITVQIDYLSAEETPESFGSWVGLIRKLLVWDNTGRGQKKHRMKAQTNTDFDSRSFAS